MNGNKLALAFAMTICFSAAPEVRAQDASTYTVAQGDDIPKIVKKLKYKDVTESQMYFAVVQKNISAFPVNSVERVTPGMKLEIPSQADVKAVDVKKADEYMANLRKAEGIYSEGVAAEKAGNMQGAVEKYLAAAKIGHAVAAQKLGQLYDKGVTKTLSRDLQESITYYQKARERGREIKGPDSRAPQPAK